MILKNIRYIITQNPDRKVLENKDLKVSDREITEISENIRPEQDEETVDFSGKAVLPGLINCHTHVAMALFRGISDDKGLEDWLHEDIFPAEEAMTEEDVYHGARIGVAELLKTGTTCFNDQYAPEEPVAEAVDEVGVRAVLGQGFVDLHGVLEDKLEKSREFIRKWQGHDRITPAVNPHSIYTVSDEGLQKAREQAEKFDTPIHIHVSETRKENQDSLEENGMTPTELIDQKGLLTDRTICAHGTHLTEKDRELINEREAGISHNPCANLKLGNGIADTPDYLERGIKTGLGTDGVASNNSFNMFEEMKFASLIQKNSDPTEMTAQQMLDIATIKAAEVLSLEHEIGSIEEGKKADIIAINLEREDMNPRYGKEGLISNLVFSFNGEVSDVFVDGQQLVAEKQLIADIESSRAKVENFADSIIK
jgi:5-methylthioadenosine/S-adenosylhomocysteine deaminase